VSLPQTTLIASTTHSAPRSPPSRNSIASVAGISPQYSSATAPEPTCSDTCLTSEKVNMCAMKSSSVAPHSASSSATPSSACPSLPK
jgi:hypothetical protein